MVFWENYKDELMNYLKRLNWLTLFNSFLVLVLVMLGTLFTTGSFIAYHFELVDSSFSTFTTFSYLLSVIGLAYYWSHHINLKRVLQTVVLYTIYLSSSYFLFLTSFINRMDFKPEKTFTNDFWEIRYLPTIVLIFTLAFLLKTIRGFWQTDFMNDEDVSPTVLLTGLFLNIVLCDSRVVDFIIGRFTPLLASGQNSRLFGELLPIILPLLLLFFPLIYSSVKAFSDIRRNRSGFSLAFAFSFLWALIFNYTLQLGLGKGGIFLGRYIFPGATLYQILFLAIFFILIYSLINRFVPATLLILTLGISASVANSLKVAMRSEPLLVSDLIWLKQLGLLLGFINKFAVLYLILGLIFVSAVYVITRKRFFKGRIIKNHTTQMVILVGILGFIYNIHTIFRDENYNKIQSNVPVVSVLNNWQDINWLGFEINARYKSLAFVWTKQLSKRLMEKPKGYSKETIQTIYEKYKSRAALINQTRDQDISDQTVIYILSESFADPNNIKGISTSRSVIPNIRDIQSKTTSGFMKSDFYGGGTANMEFQALTGLPLYNYAMVSTAYTEIVPKMTYFPSVSAFFDKKNRVAMHPANGQNYSRNTIYHNLHFDTFLTDKEIGKPEPNVGVYTSDEALYNQILQNIELGKDKFFSIITMQNHAPWSVGDPKDLTVSGDYLNEKEHEELLNFSRLLTYTDTAIAQFLEQLSHLDQKVTVVFYGDHLPGIYSDKVFEQLPERKYMTDYFIWSNDKEQKLNHPLVNSSDFMALLFEHTSSKVSPYVALLTDVLHQASVDKTALSIEDKTIANDMRLVQYDISFGKGYSLEYGDFFGMSLD